MLDKEKWEYSREEAKDLAQDYLDREETRASCIKYFISHFKISNATANRWYNKIYDEDDCTPYDVYLDHEPTEFSDGAYRVHYECLTEEEKEIMEKNNA